MHKLIRNILSPAETQHISDLYMSMPDETGEYTPGEVNTIRNLVVNIYQAELRLARQIYGTGFRVENVSGQPYTSVKEMRQRMRETKVLEISTDFNNSPIFGQQVNLLFRAMHDMQHAQTPDCEFFLDGEICAFAVLARYPMPRWMLSIFFCEIVGQICALRHAGKGKEYQVQKLVSLPDEYIDRIIDAYKGQ